MLATIDGSENQGVRMERETSQLAAIGQLKDALTNLGGCTVNFIEKQHDGLAASGEIPLGRVPPGAITIGGRQTQKITLGHLGSTTLYHRKSNDLG